MWCSCSALPRRSKSWLKAWLEPGLRAGSCRRRVQGCLNTFLSCPYRVEVATNLERSLQQGRDLLSAYENKLVIDDTVPEDLRVVDRKREELLVSFLPCSRAAHAKPLSKSCGDSCSTHRLGSAGDRRVSPSSG